jgi:glycosyltransferase involved in cell wall biosynthesis
MKINFTLWSAGVSGGNRTIYQLANKLTEHGHDVSITSLAIGGTHKWFGEVNADFNYVGLNVFQKAARKFLLVPRWDVDWARRLAEAIPECDVNVATYCFTAYPVLWSGKGKPFYFVQGYEPLFFENEIDRNLSKLTYNLPLQKLVVSHWLEQKVGGFYVGNGVDLSQFNFKEKLEKPFVLFFAKGKRWLNRLKRVMATKSVSYEFLVVDGELNVRQMLDAYRRAWVIVFVSDAEGFGLVPLESMACGTPVISSFCSGVEEYLVNGVNGLTVPVGSPIMEYLEKTEFVLAREDVYNRLVKGGLETAKQHDFESVVDRFEEAVKR